MPRIARETRATEGRAQNGWKPPSILPEVEERDGYVHRWVRTNLLSKADNTNVSARFREGWEPCKSEDYPELQVMVDRDSRFPGSIEIGGLLLCKAPREIMEQRSRYYQDMARENMEAVDNNLMKENDPRMPLFTEKKTSVTFGRGTK